MEKGVMRRIDFIVPLILFLLTTTYAYSYAYPDPEEYNEDLLSADVDKYDEGKSHYYYGNGHSKKRKGVISDTPENELTNVFSQLGSGTVSAKDNHRGEQDWSGKWLAKSPRVLQQKSGPYSSKAPGRDKHNRVQMGVANGLCDDAKTNLTNDWDGSAVNYTCYHPNSYYPKDEKAPSILECEDLPSEYRPGHECINKSIHYDHPIPTYGDHRPLWPMFGEYKFVPRERWLHNIEHGAVVMLYHPCAHPNEVKRLKNIVTGCFGKHVITPSTFLSRERPLALVAWGCRLLMAVTDEEKAVNFIKEKALKGPEGTYTKEGQYDWELIQSGNKTGAGARVGYAKVDCDSSSFF